MARANSASDDDAALEEVLADTTGPAAEAAAKKAAAIRTLAELFPTHERAQLAQAVAAHPDNLDAAATELVSRGATSVEADERLAASLQAAERQRALARATPQTNGGARSGAQAFRPTSSVLAGAVAGLRDVVVPTVHARLKSLQFANVSSETSTMRYAMRDVGVVAFSLPADNVSVRAMGGVVRVYMVNMFVSLAVGQFQYQSTGLIPWADSGALDASAAGLTAVATLRPGRTTAGAIALGVRDVDVRVDGAVRVRARGTSADWAYNTLAAVCKPLVVAYIKDSVQQQLRAMLNDELLQFEYVAEPQVRELDEGAHATTSAREGTADTGTAP